MFKVQGLGVCRMYCWSVLPRMVLGIFSKPLSYYSELLGKNSEATAAAASGPGQ